MKVCIISQYFPPDPGGASTRARNLASALSDAGHSVVVLAAQPHYPNGRWGDRLPHLVREGERITIIRTPILPFSHRGPIRHALLYCFFALVATWDALFEVRHAQIVWCVSPNYLSFVPGLCMRFVHKSRIILEVVDLWPTAVVTSGYVSRGMLASLLEKMCNIFYTLTDCVTTLTSEMAEAMVRVGVPESKIHILPNMVDSLVSDSKARVGLRPSMFYNRFVIMYCGNLGAIYDFKVLLKAAEGLRSEPEALIVIRGLGEGTRDIERKAREMDSQNLLLIFSLASREEALRQMAWADVCVLPMKKGFDQTASYPTKLLEYLALGKPVIALANGPIRTLLQSNEAGIVVPPGDSEGLIESILKLMNDPGLTRTLGVNAAKLSGKFSPSLFAEGSIGVLASLEQEN